MCVCEYKKGGKEKFLRCVNLCEKQKHLASYMQEQRVPSAEVSLQVVLGPTVQLFFPDQSTGVCIEVGVWGTG